MTVTSPFQASRWLSWGTKLWRENMCQWLQNFIRPLIYAQILDTSRCFVPSRSHSSIKHIWVCLRIGYFQIPSSSSSSSSSSFSLFLFDNRILPNHHFPHSDGPKATWFTNAKAWAPARFHAVVDKWWQVMVSFPGCSELESLNLGSGIDVLWFFFFFSVCVCRFCHWMMWGQETLFCPPFSIIPQNKAPSFIEWPCLKSTAMFAEGIESLSELSPKLNAGKIPPRDLWHTNRYPNYANNQILVIPINTSTHRPWVWGKLPRCSFEMGEFSGSHCEFGGYWRSKSPRYSTNSGLNPHMNWVINPPGGFLSHRGTPSHHAFQWDFPL